MKESAVFERVLKTISRYNMLASGVRVIAAVSGGADSVCLLQVLREVAPATLAGVAHFNHKLRGEASEEDERFVAAIAGELGLPFYRAEADLMAVQDNLEQACRRARKKFFAGLIHDGACDRIATGHTRDDQAETVLFRVLRGSGLSGLAGIHPVTAEGIVRPLIEVTRIEVEDFLRARRIAWREDATNLESKFARNRIRHDLLPQLARDWNPRIGEALAHLADLAFEEERYWSQVPDFLTVQSGGIEMAAGRVAALPRALARRMVRRAILLAKGDLRRIEYQHVEAILELAAADPGHGRLRLPGVDAVRSFDWIRLAPPSPIQPVNPIPVAVPGVYPAPDGATRIRLEFADRDDSTACANLRLELSGGRIPAPMELRGWRPGDHYRPVGQSSDQKVKDLFQKGRIPSWRRRFWPMLTSGGEILWARGFGAAADYAAGEGPGPVLRIMEADAAAR
jgi:tRNA(Ile)-lysidine synthase